jgi:hypothetical protein
MLVIGNRQDEVFLRASFRSVSAIVTMAVTSDKNVSPLKLGIIMDEKGPALPVTTIGFKAQGAHYWQQEDTCKPAITVSPKLLGEVLDELGERTKQHNTKTAASEDIKEKQKLFNAEDLITKATGIPAHVRLDFIKGDQDISKELSMVPFPKLKNFLHHLFQKLAENGGGLQTVDVTHVSAMTVFDFYEIGTQKYVPGNKISYGDVMLGKAYNLLGDVGMPLVIAPGSKLH